MQTVLKTPSLISDTFSRFSLSFSQKRPICHMFQRQQTFLRKAHSCPVGPSYNLLVFNLCKNRVQEVGWMPQQFAEDPRSVRHLPEQLITSYHSSSRVFQISVQHPRAPVPTCTYHCIDTHTYTYLKIIKTTKLSK